MANWVIWCSENYFYAVIKYLRQKLFKREIIYCDETPAQVLKEKGKKPQTKSYMWLYHFGNDGKYIIILYDYKSFGNRDHAEEYLKGFERYTYCNGYIGYNKPERIIKCRYWAHLKRCFIEEIPNNKTKGVTTITNAEIGRNYCNKISEIEDEISKLSTEERYIKCLGQEKHVFEALRKI